MVRPATVSVDELPLSTATKLNSKSRILSIQALRGVAAMVVAFYHLHHVENKYFATHTTGALQYGWMGVDLFFVISGVVISLVTAGKFQNRPNAFRFLYHRLARIFPIYWVYYFIVLAAYLYNPMWISAATGHHLDVWPSFFLLPCYSMVVGQAWSLSYELYFYLAFFLILLFVPERYVLHALAAWGGIICLFECFLRPQYQHYVLWLLTDTFLYEFLLGCVLLHIFRRFEFAARTGGAMVLLSIAWFGAWVILTSTMHGGNSDWIKNSYWMRPLCCGVTGFLLLFGIMVMERAGAFKVNKALSDLGDWSYSIYLSHQIVVELVGRIVARFFDFYYAIFLVEVIAIPAVVLVGYCSYRWLENPVLHYLYRRSES